MSNQKQGYKVHAATMLVSGATMDKHINYHAKKLERCPYDCGMDIFPTAIKEHVALPAGTMFILNTGLHLTPVPGTYALLTDRSSSLRKLGGAQVIEGKIDAGYTGELLIRVMCPVAAAEEVVHLIQNSIDAEVAVAQVVIHIFCMPIFQPRLESGLIVPFSDLGGRGSNGFGSTDKVS